MQGKQPLAPVVLFVYNRLEHTRRTIEALSNNTLASESRLYIFSDAPPNAEAVKAVEAVRDYIHTLNAADLFGEVTIELAKENKGLADSIIAGVSKVMQLHGKAIVMEDDLLSAPDFLSFMNDALAFYEKDESVGSISGYSPLKKMPKHYTHSIWKACRTSSYGWATWHSRWKEVSWKIDDFEEFRKDKKARRAFDACGSDRFDRLRRQLEVGANSWSIRFGYWQFRAGKYTIFPSLTRIQNIGWDGSGVHKTSNIKSFNTDIKSKPMPYFLEYVDPDPVVIAQLKKIYSGSAPGRIARYLRNNGFENLERMLRKMAGR
ncbi:sugar transferase [hydrothermal vent metagenome]|uniref:Sugar transferase n=1 Tax=hydrothermal vent metagenome TaxID=652676 RepID=A0A1W1E7N3_9ZZZZ